MTGGVIRAALRAPPLLLPPRMKVVFGAAADGSSIFTTARGFTQPLATAAPPNKTHHEQRLCLDPHCNVFHMCPPPSASPPSPASHSHVSPILPPSCQCHPFSLLLATYSPLEKKKGCKTPFHLSLSGVLVKEKITNRAKGVSQSGAPNSDILFPSLTGEGEEVHAPPGQPEGPRRGEKLHVQQAHILHF